MVQHRGRHAAETAAAARSPHPPSRDGRTDELHLRRRTRTAGVLDRTLHRHPRRGARPLPHLALYAARAGLCAGTGARHAGEDLFQERKRLARRLAQAQHGPAAGLLQRQTRHQAPDDRNGRRTMGFGHRAGQPVLRPRPESLHGQGQLRAETLPQATDEHVGSRGDPLAQHADRRGTPRSGRRSRLLGQPRAGDLRGGRDSRTAPRRHALLPGQRTEPRAAAPDRHRRGGARADGDGGRRTRRPW